MTPAVVVVGAGVVGASVAWHLARLGWQEILVLDRARATAAGSTGRATGGFRAQYGTAINVRLSLLAREKLRRFQDEIGADPGYDPAGYLWLATTGAELDALAAGLAVQHAAGLHESRLVTPGEIAELNPAVRLDGVVGGAYCPTDGFIRPAAIADGYLDAATRLGVRVWCGVDVFGCELLADGRIAALVTNAGAIPCGAVVNAAGPWAGEFAEVVGVPLPVTPLRRQVAATIPTDALPPRMPMTIWCGDGFHLRARDGRVLLLRPSPGVPGRPFADGVDDDWVRGVAATARERVPALAAVPVDRAACWAGLYEMSPDRHAILGAAPGCPNLYLANGSSGHGVMHAPALGQLLAELMTDGQYTSLDARPLRPERFAEGEPIHDAGVL